MCSLWWWWWRLPLIPAVEKQENLWVQWQRVYTEKPCYGVGEKTHAEWSKHLVLISVHHTHSTCISKHTYTLPNTFICHTQTPNKDVKMKHTGCGARLGFQCSRGWGQTGLQSETLEREDGRIKWVHFKCCATNCIMWVDVFPLPSEPNVISVSYASRTSLQEDLCACQGQGFADNSVYQDMGMCIL